MEMELRGGFSLIEVIIAMLILTVAVLAMGASTGLIIGQVRGAELRTEQMMSVRQAAEQLRAAPWSQLATECASLSIQQDEYTVECNFSQPTGTLVRLQLISQGPGYAGPQSTRADTTVISVARPVQ